MSLTRTLTGRQRVRVMTGGYMRNPVLVLQVEVRDQGYEVDGHGGGQEVNRTSWRDARVEDLDFKLIKEM